MRIAAAAQWVSFALWASTATGHNAVPVYTYEIVHSYPHDQNAFTEGLFYLNGYLYESTGLENQSTIRKVQLDTGKIISSIALPGQYFGEGIVNWGERLISLTWKSNIGFVRDLKTFQVQSQFSYPGEGWALTQNGKQIIMSDGTSELRFLDPETLRETRRLTVTLDEKPVENLNELEWVKGEIYANVWRTNSIVRINPKTGAIVGLVDLTGILPSIYRLTGVDDVLNGIAYDPHGNHLFVTGKHWPKVFEIRLRPVGADRRRAL